VTFYLDEDLAPTIAQQLRRRGTDAVSVHDVGMTGLSDLAQLDHAAAAGRALVTRNVRHFRVLGDDRIRSQTPHAGIVLCPASLRGSEYRVIVDALIQLSRRYPRGLGSYDVVFLTRPDRSNPKKRGHR
jgi:predicted nuclease of predicted toxin-antitoxin system